jgi:TATA-box binding protein (TBP) (component of TFIID and TFIIIB)
MFINKKRNWPTPTSRVVKVPILCVYPPNCVNVVNIASTYFLGKKIVAESIYKQCNYSCIKNQDPIAICVGPPHGMATIFNSGKVNMIGLDNVYAACVTAETVTKLARRYLNDPELTMKDLFVGNMTATYRLPFQIDIRKVEKTVPGANKPSGYPNVTIETDINEGRLSLICAKDNVNITGAISKEQIIERVLWLMEYLQDCILDVDFLPAPKRSKKEIQANERQRDHIIAKVDIYIADDDDDDDDDDDEE